MEKKKTRIGMLLRRETGNEHEKREIEKRERNERILVMTLLIGSATV